MIEKMQAVIDRVLGDGYIVSSDSENKFRITGLDGTNMEMESIHDLKSHWKEGISKSINLIIAGRIKKALNEI